MKDLVKFTDERTWRGFLEFPHFKGYLIARHEPLHSIVDFVDLVFSDRIQQCRAGSDSKRSDPKRSKAFLRNLFTFLGEFKPEIMLQSAKSLYFEKNSTVGNWAFRRRFFVIDIYELSSVVLSRNLVSASLCVCSREFSFCSSLLVVGSDSRGCPPPPHLPPQVSSLTVSRLISYSHHLVQPP